MSPIRILGLAGSPRLNGNSRRLLTGFLDGVKSTGAIGEELLLEPLGFSPCQACGGCNGTGRCVVDDGMQKVYERIEAADGVVLAAPVHFGGMGGRAKAAIDRFQCFWAAKYLLGQPRIPANPVRLGYFICVGGMKPKRFCENALEIAKVWFTVINLRPAGELLVRGIDDPEDMDSRPDLIADARLAGQRFAAQTERARTEQHISDS